MSAGPDTELFGLHLLMDGYGAPAAILSDQPRLLRLLQELPLLLGMHAIAEPMLVEVGPQNRKDPGGLSGFVLIAESHFSFHTFPARGFVSIDVYTCQDQLDAERIEALLCALFELKDHELTLHRRGTRYPAHDIAS